MKTFNWAIIGAGPAGIAAVGKLLDEGVLPQDILWCDPVFKVGDLGMFWNNVSSNTKVKYFKDFLFAAQSFEYKSAAIDFPINELPEEETCNLNFIVAPLQWISDHLVEKVNAVKITLYKIFLSEQVWTLCSESKNFTAKNVILATGAVPSSLNYPGLNVIPFDTAIDKEKLSSIIHLNETYGVFGSSHSALIIVCHLVDLGVKKIINFYRSPCRYAIEMDGWTLFDNTGLKGATAAWARKYIDGVWPTNLVRYSINDAHIAHFLPECNHVIYAVGFERRKSLVIGDYENLRHNPYVGIIAPGLFGFGIAYPENKADPFGTIESQVGLWKFMVYLNKVLPLWLKYST